MLNKVRRKAILTRVLAGNVAASTVAVDHEGGHRSLDLLWQVIILGFLLLTALRELPLFLSFIRLLLLLRC